MVEFALVLAPLLVIIFGFLELGLAMNDKIDSTHLSAEGARYFVVNQNPGGTSLADLQQYILDHGDTAAVKNGVVTICYPPSDTGTTGKVGDPVRVKVAPSTQPSIVNTLPLIGQTLPNLAVSSETTMRLEALPTKFSGAGACPP